MEDKERGPTGKRIKKKGEQNTNTSNKTMYRLYRSDNFGNANEVSSA